MYWPLNRVYKFILLSILGPNQNGNFLVANKKILCNEKKLHNMKNAKARCKATTIGRGVHQKLNAYVSPENRSAPV